MSDEVKIKKFDFWKQEDIPVDQIKPNPKNPRIPLTPGMPLYEKLRNSIDRFNYIDPIIWNKRTGMIVSGHQRFQVIQDIAKENGEVIETVPVIVVDMDEKDQDAVMVAVNKITGLWDQEKLSALFREMDEEERKYTGFDDFEIGNMLDDNEASEDVFEGMEDEPVITREKKEKIVTCPHCGKEFNVNKC